MTEPIRADRLAPVTIRHTIPNGEALASMDKQDDPPVAPALTLAADAEAARVAESIVAAWREIDRDLAPIIGPRGVAALYKRSLQLSARSHAWLAGPQVGTDEIMPLAMDLDALQARLAQQDAAGAAAGGEAFLRTFYDLLTTLIGPSLTGRLLHSVWTTFLSGPAVQDTLP